jgi:hypothetical protein
MVFPAKDGRAVFDKAVDKTLRDVCLGIERRYQITFLEIGIDKDQFIFGAICTDLQCHENSDDDKGRDFRLNYLF